MCWHFVPQTRPVSQFRCGQLILWTIRRPPAMSFALAPIALPGNGYFGLWQVECPTIDRKETRRNCKSYGVGSVREGEGVQYWKRPWEVLDWGSGQGIRGFRKTHEWHPGPSATIVAVQTYHELLPCQRWLAQDILQCIFLFLNKIGGQPQREGLFQGFWQVQGHSDLSAFEDRRELTVIWCPSTPPGPRGSVHLARKT